MKTKSSRFQIHDDLTAPDGSGAVLGSLSKGGQLPNVLGVLAGSPAALRAYVRARFELRNSSLERRDEGADRRSRSPSTTAPSPAWRCTCGRRDTRASASMRSRGRSASSPTTSASRRCWRCCTGSIEGGPTPAYLVEEAREAGWTDEQLLEAITFVAMEQMIAMVNVAGDVPVDGSVEESRHLGAA